MRCLNTILLVDDYDADTFLYKRVIRSSGAAEQVEVARNGQEALDYLARAEQPPELILLDINMPVMNGWQFLEAYAGLPPERRAQAVYVMLTAELSAADEARMRDGGLVQGFERKPLRPAALEALIDAHF